MLQFKAQTLEEAYEKATSKFNCSITDLEIEIVQLGTKGFLGFFTKETIILADTKSSQSQPSNTTNQNNQTKHIEDTNLTQNKSSSKKKILQPESNVNEKIFDDFYSSKDSQDLHDSITLKRDENTIIDEIHTKINQLFSQTCYNLDEIKVCFYDTQTVYIVFEGKDAALLIGKEGYRYKALSYLLFNWINDKYKLMVRLEVSEFLKTQENAIHTYLVPVIETIKNDGSFKTKPLDGILVHIALKILRDEFPQKYVAVKTNNKGDKYILVNEYKK